MGWPPGSSIDKLVRQGEEECICVRDVDRSKSPIVMINHLPHCCAVFD